MKWWYYPSLFISGTLGRHSSLLGKDDWWQRRIHKDWDISQLKSSFFSLHHVERTAKPSTNRERRVEGTPNPFWAAGGCSKKKKKLLVLFNVAWPFHMDGQRPFLIASTYFRRLIKVCEKRNEDIITTKRDRKIAERGALRERFEDVSRCDSLDVTSLTFFSTQKKRFSNWQIDPFVPGYSSDIFSDRLDHLYGTLSSSKNKCIYPNGRSQL